MKPSAKDDNSPIISLHVNDNDVNLPINHKISSVHEVQSENYSESGDAIVRPCLLCKKRLFGQNNYISHMKAEHGSAQGPYPCAKCDQTFLTGQKIVEHFKISHDGAVKTSKGLEHFPCRDCNLSFLNKATFRQHCRVKHGAYKKKKEGFRCQEEECPEAGVIFNSFIAFRTHMTQSHNIAPLKCETCGKRFMDVQALKHHTEMHFGTDEYPCDVCFKKFRTRGRLFAHRSLHLGRRYSCQDCDFKTRSRGGLTIHRQLKHEEKRFACKFCGKKFGTKQNMEAHTRIHTGESPYECEVCAMKFKRLHHLRSHLVTVSHTQKVNDLESKGIPIPQELEQEQKRIQKGRAQIKDISAVKDQSDGAPTKGLLECAVCTLSFHSKNKLRSHLKSNQHLKKTMRPDDEETQVISSSYDSAKGQAMVRVQIKPETASYNQYSEQLHISSSHHLDYARPGESSVTVLNLDDKVLLDEEDILMMDFGGGSDQINVAAAESNLLLQCHNPAQVGGGGSLENVQLVIVDHPVSNPNVIASHTSDRAVHYSSEDLVRLSENSAASSAPPLILAEDDKIIPLPFETT